MQLRNWMLAPLGAVLIAASVAGCSGGSSSTASSSATSSRSSASSSSAPSTSASGPTATSSGATSATVSSAAAPDACGLLGVDAIQAAFGGTAGTGSPTSAPDGSESICGWVVTGASGDGFGVQLDVHARRSADDWAQQRAASSAPPISVSGLGDDAFAEKVTEGGVVYDDLWVRKGSLDFRVEVLKDLGVDPLKPLAQAVLAHL